MEWEYLSFRLWIGIWIGVILLIMVATDASFVVQYITRFTEENFATLIAVIFIIKAIEKVIHIGDKYPMAESPCYCDPDNKGLASEAGWRLDYYQTFSKKHFFRTESKRRKCYVFMYFILDNEI